MTAPARALHVRAAAGDRLLAVPDALAAQVERQHGVLTRRQLDRTGFDKGRVRAAIEARRWQCFGRQVVVLHNAALTAMQRDWVVVLLPGKPAALAGLSALASWGVTGFAPDSVHVVVAGDSNAAWPRWVKVHNSRRFSPSDIDNGPIPRTSVERSAIDAAAWSARPRRACAVLCAAVQQRLTTAARLEAALREAGSVRHVQLLRNLLGDIGGGGHTLGEIDLGPLARRAGLPQLRRQALRREPGGKVRYLDAEIELPDRTLLAIEVDGSVHREPLTWWDDMSRQNEVVIAGQPMLRFPSMMMRISPERIISDLRRIRLAHS